MSNIMNPIIGKSKLHLLNSKALVEKIKDLILDVDDIWISRDVEALFPSVPVKEALDIIETRQNNDPTLHKWTLLLPADIMELLCLEVDMTTFTFKGNLYQ